MAVALVGALLLQLPWAQRADAHQDVRVGICIPYYKGGACARGEGAPSYRYGQDVVVKGRVRPGHSGTVKVERRKKGSDWEVVSRRQLDDARYRYVWHTRRRHADQGEPYKFRVTLPRHDVSDVQKVFVLFSE